MKRILTVLLVACLGSTAVNAQDSTMNRKANRDTIPGADSTKKNKQWHNDKMPNDKHRKNWPDTMGRADTLRRIEK